MSNVLSKMMFLMLPSALVYVCVGYLTKIMNFLSAYALAMSLVGIFIYYNAGRMQVPPGLLFSSVSLILLPSGIWDIISGSGLSMTLFMLKYFVIIFYFLIALRMTLRIVFNRRRK